MADPIPEPEVSGPVLTATSWPDDPADRPAWLARAFCVEGHGPNAPQCPSCALPEASVPVSKLRGVAIALHKAPHAVGSRAAIADNLTRLCDEAEAEGDLP